MVRIPRWRFRGAPGSTAAAASTFAVQIASVSGTFTEGQSITVSGSSMFNQQTAGWHSFHASNTNAWSFEGVNSTADGYGGLSGNIPPTYVSTQSLFGGQSLFCRIQKSTGSYTCPADLEVSYNNRPLAEGASSGGEFYTRAYGRWIQAGAHWPTFQKWIIYQLASGTSTVTGHIFSDHYVQPSGGVGTTPPGFLLVYLPGTTNASRLVPWHSWGGNMQSSRWYCVETYCRYSPNLSTQRITVWLDGAQVLDVSTFVEEMRYQFVLHGIVNGCDPGGDYDVQCWTDGLVTSDARIYPGCMVEIADSSNYASANKLYQAPLLISDTSVQFVFSTNEGDSPTLTGSNRWMFITNNAQERSSAHQVA